MYTPPAFKMDDQSEVHNLMRQTRSATLVTATSEGLKGTLLPMYLESSEGPNGTLYAHLARANDQWKSAPLHEALAIFNGPEAYISPNWYATKQETHRVVPTWNYTSVHAYGPVEFFEEPDRLLNVITKLTNLHERAQTVPWSVGDAPPDFVKAQLRGIVGVRIPINRWDAKKKMSQNRNAADRAGVVSALSASDSPMDRAVSIMVPRG